MTQLYSDIIYISLFHSGTIQPFLHCLVLRSPLLHDWDYVLTCLFSWLELCIRSVYWDYVPVSFLGTMYPLRSDWDHVLVFSLIGTLSLKLCNSLLLYHWDYVPLLRYLDLFIQLCHPIDRGPQIHPPVLSFPLKYILRVDYFGFSHYSSFLSQAIIHTHLRSTFLIWNVDLMSFSYFPIPYDLSLFWASKPLPRSHSSLSCTSLLCRLTSRWHT